MENFLLTKRAKEEAHNLIKHFEKTGSFSFSEDKENYPVSLLKNGQMFAVMVCRTKNKKEKILYSFSGAINGEYIIPGYVSPCFLVEDFHNTFDPYNKEIHRLTDEIEIKGETEKKRERKELSAEAQKKVGEIFTFSTWNGDKIHGLPKEYPTGTGECAGLKLINHALKMGYEMIGLAEFKYTDKNNNKVEFFPPCKERCGLLLPRMLGLEYIYADGVVAVVNKNENFLSVPGRKVIDSVSYRFHTLFPSSPSSPFPHRLDMDTSGVMVLCFTKESLAFMQREFENHDAKKVYIAIVEGCLENDSGTISVKSRKDMANPPLQIIDKENGKEGITHYSVIKRVKRNGKDYTRVRFTLETGRTHQLRLHSKYIGHPIVGDNLYGHKIGNERLFLHSESISFIHPESKERVFFTSPCPF